jgi:hypothetical protein
MCICLIKRLIYIAYDKKKEKEKQKQHAKTHLFTDLFLKKQIVLNY